MPEGELPPIENDDPPKAPAEKYSTPINLVKAIHAGEAGTIPCMNEIMQTVGVNAGWTVQNLHAAILSAQGTILATTSDSRETIRNQRRREIQRKWCASVEGDNIGPLKNPNHHPDPKLIGVYQLLFFDMLRDMMILKASSSSFDLDSRIGLTWKPHQISMDGL